MPRREAGSNHQGSLKVGGQCVLVPVDDDENLCVLDLVGAKLFQLFTPDDRFKVGNPVLGSVTQKPNLPDHRIGTSRSIPLHRAATKPTGSRGQSQAVRMENSSTRSPSTLTVPNRVVSISRLDIKHIL